MRRLVVCFALCLLCVTGCEEDQSGFAGLWPSDEESGSDQPAQPCESGSCASECVAPKALCDGECIDLAAMHLSSCTACEAGYCDGDDDLTNGCEISVTQDSALHCGRCGNACAPGENCDGGTCVAGCEGDRVRCNGECLNIGDLHLSSCSACESGYCDGDNNLVNGCEVQLSENSTSHCGSCGHACNPGEECNGGECVKACDNGNTGCFGQCVNLDELRLSSCSACADGFCDGDNNLSNGCELSVLDDVNNCGACGVVCNNGDKCMDGMCAHRYYVMYDAYRWEATQSIYDSSRKKVGTLPTYSLVYVLENKDGWNRIATTALTSSDTWVHESQMLDAGDQYEGRVAIDFAETFLYNRNDKLCTYDFKFRTEPPMLPNLKYNNKSYDNHCADFVSAILTTEGIDMLTEHQTGAASLGKYCAAGNDGYRLITDPTQAKPGDIWIKSNGGHSELVIGYYPRGGLI